MARAPVVHPRKKASQERSRATVDALIEATARVLVREGFERASTNRIAAEAGASIGSLYQYFPTKEALVAAVIERHKNDMMEVLRRALVRVAGMPLQQGVRELVALMIDAHRVDPELHRVLVEQIPRIGRLAEVEGLPRGPSRRAARARPRSRGFRLRLFGRDARARGRAAQPRAAREPQGEGLHRRGDLARDQVSDLAATRFAAARSSTRE